MERKLQELEETTQANHVRSALDDPYHDIVEFAQSYFNPHERSPEGTYLVHIFRCFNHYCSNYFVVVNLKMRLISQGQSLLPLPENENQWK